MRVRQGSNGNSAVKELVWDPGIACPLSVSLYSSLFLSLSLSRLSLPLPVDRLTDACSLR